MSLADEVFIVAPRAWGTRHVRYGIDYEAWVLVSRKDSRILIWQTARNQWFVELEQLLTTALLALGLGRIGSLVKTINIKSEQ